MNVQRAARLSMICGDVTKTLCDSKKTVLDMIYTDKADAMSVGDVVLIGEATVVSHYAVRFNDRSLGRQVRKLTMEGFNLLREGAAR